MGFSDWTFRRMLAQLRFATAMTTLVGASLVAVPSAHAVVPATVSVNGLIATVGGGPGPDGKYALTFGLYKEAVGGAPVWTEGPLLVTVKGGQFSVQIGAKSPLSNAPLGSLSSAWLGVAVDDEPEMTRVPMGSAMYALRSVVAEGLDCSGCITANHLAPGLFDAFAKKEDLAQIAAGVTWDGLVGKPKFAPVATSGVYSDLDGTPNLAKVATTGSYADLTGKPLLATVAGSGKYTDLTGIPSGLQPGTICGSGLVVRGFLPDGGLDCVAGGKPGAGDLPADGIDEISNNLIFNQFLDTFNGTPNNPIKDNNPTGTSDVIDVPDVGIAQKLTISVELTNSNLGGLRMVLFDPNNASYELCGGPGKPACGKPGDGLKTSYPDASKTLTGDLTLWHGKSPKGKWYLNVIDTDFCTAPGCTPNIADGKVTAWSVNVQTLSSKKIQIKGDLIVDGKITSGGNDFTQNSVDFSICADKSPQGPCVAAFTKARIFVEAAKYCASLKADVCTDSQAYAARRQSVWMLQSNWTNSYADNDSSVWNAVNGGVGDNHNDQSLFSTPCCYNAVPTQPGEQVLAGIRVLKINNAANATWEQAVDACMALNADLCDKGQYWQLRNNGHITTTMWSSDHSDNDSNYSASAIGNTNDDTSPGDKYGYACCATKRTTLACDAPAFEVNGVCVAKVFNSNSYTFGSASQQCAALGARICSIAQSAVLRTAGQLSTSGNWTASHSDNDGSQARSGVGNSMSDDPSDGQNWAFACCY